MVPVVDLTRRLAAHRDAFLEAAERVLTSGTLLFGAETEALEAELARSTGHAHAVAVGSGAAALQLALQALGIGPGHEVVVPGFTAVPTASAVMATGAVPVPVDVDPEHAALDLAEVQRALTERTRAVVPVHLYGRPAPLPPSDVPVVEDAAQAHGALRNDGSAATVYSFYPTKNAGGIGDGGVVLTDDADLAARVRRLRVHGMAGQYVHVDVAQNSRLSELEAAWLRVVLPHLPAGNERRRAIALRYREAAPALRWHAAHPRHVYHLCVVRVAARDHVRADLAALGVGTAVHYPLALTQQPAYRHLVRRPCPQAEAWAAECVTLPCFPELTDAEVDQVCEALATLQDRQP